MEQTLGEAPVGNAPAAGGPTASGPAPFAWKKAGALLILFSMLIPVACAAAGPLLTGETVVLLIQGGVLALLGWMWLEYQVADRPAKWKAAFFVLALLVLAEVAYTSYGRVQLKVAMNRLKLSVAWAQALRDGKPFGIASQVEDLERVREGDGLTGFSNALARETVRVAREEVAMEAALAKLDPAGILLPDTLVSAAAIEKARARHRELATLIDAQGAAAEAALARLERIYADGDFSGREREYLNKVLENKRDTIRRLQRDLQEATRAAIGKREEMLAFAQANAGRLKLKGDELRIEGAAARAAYLKLEEELKMPVMRERVAFEELVTYRRAALSAVAGGMQIAAPERP